MEIQCCKRESRIQPSQKPSARRSRRWVLSVDGENAVFGGTSAVAPLWAGLIARLNQQMGKSVGFLNPVIYAQAVEASGFRDITQGDNGSFDAAKGWDACTGLGSPNGAQLLTALTGPNTGPASVNARARGSKKPAA